MYYNRFDIVEAHYWFCADYHEGQWTNKYERLCRISKYYTPSPLSYGRRTMNENAASIYDALVSKWRPIGSMKESYA
jgi:hypothetical protein